MYLFHFGKSDHCTKQSDKIRRFHTFWAAFGSSKSGQIVLYFTGRVSELAKLFKPKGVTFFKITLGFKQICNQRRDCLVPLTLRQTIDIQSSFRPLISANWKRSQILATKNGFSSTAAETLSLRLLQIYCSTMTKGRLTFKRARRDECAHASCRGKDYCMAGLLFD